MNNGAMQVVSILVLQKLDKIPRPHQKKNALVTALILSNYN